MRYIFPIWLTLLILISSCRPDKPITTSEIEETKESFRHSSDAKLQAVYDLEPFYEEMSVQQKAAYGYTFAELLLTPALLRELKEYDQDTLIDYIDFSIQYHTSHKNIQQLTTCYLGKGIYYRYIRSYQKAIENILDAMELAKQLKNPQFLGMIYNEMSILAGYQDEKEKSMEYKLTAISYFKESGDTENEANVYLSLSWAYSSLKRYEDAMTSSFKALELANDSITKGEALLDIGMCYFHLANNDSALYYVKESITYPYRTTQLSARYFKLAQIYFYKGAKDSAYLHLNTSLEYPIDIYFENECYILLTQLLAERDDKKAELQYYVAKQKMAQDSINILERQPNITILEQLRTLDKQTVKIKTHRSYLIYGIFFLILISGLIIYFLYRIQRHKKREAEIYKSQLVEKEVIIDSQQEELEKQYERRLLELKEEFKRTKEKYAQKRAKSSFEQRQEIDKTIYNEVLHLNDEQAFLVKMNYMLNGLPDKLKETYPDISEKEIMWGCLFMLQLPTNDIALLLDYKQTSLYKFKQRLIKKLGFSTAKDLEQMLYDKVNL